MHPLSPQLQAAGGGGGEGGGGGASDGQDPFAQQAGESSVQLFSSQLQIPADGGGHSKSQKSKSSPVFVEAKHPAGHGI